MIKQVQSLTYQMSLMIKSQQPGPLSPIESERHSSGLWCVQCGQPGHIRQFCRSGQNCDQRKHGGPPSQNQQGQAQPQYGQRNNRGLPPRSQGGQDLEKKNCIRFMESGMHEVNVGPKGKIMVVVIVAETIIWMNVINRIKLLAFYTRWPITTISEGQHEGS